MKTVLQQFRDAFPDLHREQMAYHGFHFAPGATVYISKSKSDDKPAHIIHSALEYFPNGDDLAEYLTERNAPLDRSLYYYIIEPPLADGVIDILKRAPGSRENRDE